MKRFRKPVITWILLVILLLAAASACSKPDNAGTGSETAETEEEGAEAETLEAHTQAADFSCLNADGEEVKLSDYFGKPIVINFWATWCPPCCSELGDFNAMYEKYGEEVQFMMVDLTDGESETIEDVVAFVKENGYSFPVFYDTEESGVTAYGIDAIPQTFFINAEGEVCAKCYGSTTGSILEKQLKKLLE